MNWDNIKKKTYWNGLLMCRPQTKSKLLLVWKREISADEAQDILESELAKLPGWQCSGWLSCPPVDFPQE